MVRTEIESKAGTNGQKDDRAEKQAKSIKVRSPICQTFQTKKKYFENWMVRMEIEIRARNGWTDGRADKRTQTIKVRSPMSYISTKKRILKIGRLEQKLK